MKPTDRIRLRLNPPNVAVPQGYGDIYLDVSGQIVRELPNGATEVIGGASPTAVLAALVGEDIVADSLKVSDGTGRTLAEGSLTLNADGQVVAHDNQHSAEDLSHLVDSKEVFAFAEYLTAASMDGVYQSVLLGEIPLKTEEIASNKELHICGKIQSLWSSGNKPDVGAFLVLCKEGQDPLTQGVIFPLAEGVTSEVRQVSISLIFSVAAGEWTLVFISSSAAAFITKNNAGTITHAMGWVDGSDVSIVDPITGSTESPTKLEVHLITLDDGGLVTARLTVTGNLSAISK